MVALRDVSSGRRVLAQIAGDVAHAGGGTVLREVDSKTIVAALAQAPEGDVSTYILTAISPRLADQYRLEIEDRGKVDASESEEAQAIIAAAVRTMEASGKLSFKSPEE